MRRLVGYDRYSTQAAYHQLEYLYPLVRLHTNFFQPICKLVSRERDGACDPSRTKSSSVRSHDSQDYFGPAVRRKGEVAFLQAQPYNG